VDLKKLTTADWVIGGSSLALLIFSFLTWFEGSVSARGSSVVVESDSAWGFFFSTVGVLIAIAILTYIIVARVFSVSLGNLPWPRLLLIFGIACLVLTLLQVAFASYELPAGFQSSGIDVSTSRKIGAFLGLIAAVGVAVGGYLSFKAAKASPPVLPPAAPPPPSA
jgi:hypothetical protein